MFDNSEDLGACAKETKTQEILHGIIKDNDQLRVLLRDLGDRAKDCFLGPDQ